jgi:hypothetical protein
LELRDKTSTLETYKNLLEDTKQGIVKARNHIKELEEAEKNGVQLHPLSNNEVIGNEYDSIYRDTYEIFLINYSMGKDILKLFEDYLAVVNAMYDTKKAAVYRTLSNVLSIGVLLDEKNKYFPKLAELVKMGIENLTVKWREKHLKDYFIDLLINYKIPEWKRTNKKANWKPYQTFEEIELLAKNNKKEDAVLLLKRYLQRQWLPANNDGSYGKSYYSGYWSFESGAAVKIFNLDDTALKDIKYYPYDMVHWG